MAAYDVRSGTYLKIRNMSSEPNGIHNAAVSPIHPILVTVSDTRKELCLGHIFTGEIVQRFAAVGRPMLTPNGLAIIAGNHKTGRTNVWRFDTTTALGTSRTYRLSPDGSKGRFEEFGPVWGHSLVRSP